MNDSTPADPASAAESPPRRRIRAWPFAVLIVLIVAALLAWGGWHGWQFYRNTMQAQQAHIDALASSLQQAQAKIGKLGTQLATERSETEQQKDRIAGFKTQLETFGQRLGSLDDAVRGGRKQVQIAVIGQLLLLANDETQLAHDAVAADRALAAADRRLAVLDDPRLFAVRRAIAQERGALQAVRSPDLTGTALELGQLIAQVPKLRLQTGPRALPASTASGSPATDSDTGWWNHAWDKITRSLRSLFHIRRNDHPVEPMLPPREAALVGAVLELRLDGARAALIRRNTMVYRSELGSAQAWLRHYYRSDDPATIGMNSRLTQLAGLDLSPTLPDIGQSLDLLRKTQGPQPDSSGD